jgi:hypothetical protein
MEIKGRGSLVHCTAQGICVVTRECRYSKWSDAFPSKPQHIWLPNGLVDGAADETPSTNADHLAEHYNLRAFT